MLLNATNEAVERLREYWVTFILWAVGNFHRFVRWHAKISTKKAKLDVNLGALFRESQGLSPSRISFYDDFRVLSGVPAFFLDPDETTPSEAQLYDQQSLDNQPGSQRIIFYENRNAIICCNFSADGSRLATGHNDGSAMIWSTEHGRLLCNKELHDLSPVADIRFLKDALTTVVSCDFHGECVVWETNSDHEATVLISCSTFWLNHSNLAPKVRWPFFSKDATRLVYPVTSYHDCNSEHRSTGDTDPDPDLSKCKLVFVQECTLFLFDISAAAAAKESKHKSPFATLSVTAGEFQTDFQFTGGWLSNSLKSMVAGFNSSPFGFLVLWTDVNDPLAPQFELQGTTACWSPRDECIATWHSGAKPSSRASMCYLWWMDTLKDPNNTQSQGTNSNRSKLLNPVALRDPDRGNIVWARFVPSAHGNLGIATCVVGTHLNVILWDLQMNEVAYKLSTGIAWDEIRMNDKQAWDSHWVHVKRAYGLGAVDTSADGKWLGLYSTDANKGFVWDVASGLQVLRFSLPENRICTPEGISLQMDFHFSPTASHFALCNEENAIVWAPQNLVCPEGKSGVNVFASNSTDRMITWGQVSCKFSLNGEVVAMCRSYSLELDIWVLDTGLRCTLSRTTERFSEGECSIQITKASKRMGLLSRQNLRAASAFSMASSISDHETLPTGSRFCTFGLSADGRRIVTCMADSSVLIWDVPWDETSTAKFQHIGMLRSKYYPAWEVCFSVDRHGAETIVVCEDTGVLVWINIESRAVIARRNGGGLRRCKFSADGKKGVLMVSEHWVNIWDLVERTKIRTIDYNVWLGPSGNISFPHNISMDGDVSFVGVAEGDSCLNPTSGYLVCHPETMEEDLADVGWVPQNVSMAENSNFVVVDKFVEVQSKGLMPYGRVGGTMDRTLVEHSRSGGSARSQLSIVEGNNGVVEPPSSGTSFDGNTRKEAAVVQGNAEPVDEHDANIRFPTFDMCEDEAWEYLLESPSCGREVTDSLTILDVTGRTPPRVLKGHNLLPHRFISISPDGRRVACLSQDGRLFVWSVFGSDSCLPDWHQLELGGQSSDKEEMIKLLEKHGPGILNYPDIGRVTIPMRTIYKRRHAMLECILEWAVQNKVKMSVVGATGGDKDGDITALDIAIARRSPECAEILLEYLSQGLTTSLGTTMVYKHSLLSLSRTYPSAFTRFIKGDKLFIELPHIMVPERTFLHCTFKVTTSDTLVPTQQALQGMWLKTLMESHNIDPQHRFTGQADGGKMIVVVPRVIPYPDVAQIGRKGLLKPLMQGHVKSEVFSSLAVQAILHCQWRRFGRRLLMEEMWHFSVLWLLFTSYAIILGNLWTLLSLHNRDEFRQADKMTQNQNLAAGTLLLLAWIMAGSGFVRELTRIGKIWKEDGAWGIVEWLKSLWSWVDIGAYILLIFAIGPMHLKIAATSEAPIDALNQSSTTQNRLTVVVCIESILLSWKMLRYAQGFMATAPMVIMIREILKEIFTFLLLAFGLMFGFAIAFFVLFRVTIHKPCAEDGMVEEATNSSLSAADKLDFNAELLDCIEDKDEFLEMFGNVWLSLWTSFGMMLGETDMDLLDALDGSLRFVGTVVFVLYLLAIMVVLLNLLIAVMGDSFEKVKSTQDVQIQKGRAEVIFDIEDMMSERKHIHCSQNIQRYVHIIVPLHLKVRANAGEWQGRHTEQKLFLEKELAKLRKDLNTDMEERYAQMLDSFKMNGMEVAQRSAASPGLGVPDIGPYSEVVERMLKDDDRRDSAGTA